MKLQRRISNDRFIVLPASLAEHYVEDGDGGYLLEIVEPDGSLAPPPPKAEEVAGLKSALQKIKAERDDLRGLYRQLRDAKAADDPDTAHIAVLEQRIAEIEARIAANDADFKQKQADQDAHYTVKLAVANERHQKVLAEGDEVVLDHTLERTIRDARGISTFLLPKLKKFCRVVRAEDDAIGDSRVVGVFDDLGNLRVNADGKPVTPAQALEELRAFDPILAKTCFEPGGNGNGGAPH